VPTPKLSQELKEEARRLYNQCLTEGYSPVGAGSGPSAVREAARRLDTNPTTFLNRLKRGKYTEQQTAIQLSQKSISKEPVTPQNTRVQRYSSVYPSGPYPDYDSFVVLPDWHVPFHNTEHLCCAREFVAIFKPTVIFLPGDIFDCYQLARFPKNPELLHKLQQDLDLAREQLELLRMSAPSAVIQYIQGNHEFRLRKYLWTKAPELSGLRDLDIRHQMRLEEQGIFYQEKPIRHKSLYVKHGNLIRTKGGYTARGELERNLITGVSGHSHRMGCSYMTTPNGVIKWYECGTLADIERLSDEYLEGQTPDWHPGFAYGYVNEQRCTVYLAEIVDGSVIYNGVSIHG